MESPEAGPRLQPLNDLVEEVLAKGGGCTCDEYLAIVDSVSELTPCNFLVFSCGHDSVLWTGVNHGGRTLFLEDSAGWADRMRREHDLDVRLVDYKTKFKDHNRYLARPDLLNTSGFEFLSDTSWPAVFVDGPIGYGNGAGRMLPFKIVSELQGVARVYVHDYNRVVERAYALEYLKGFELHHQVNKLAVFHAL